MQITRVIGRLHLSGSQSSPELSWGKWNHIVYDSESVFWGAWFCFHCILLKRLWDQDRSLVLAEILHSQLFSSAHIFNSQNWISARILRVCKHEFRALLSDNQTFFTNVRQKNVRVPDQMSDRKYKNIIHLVDEKKWNSSDHKGRQLGLMSSRYICTHSQHLKLKMEYFFF